MKKSLSLLLLGASMILPVQNIYAEEVSEGDAMQKAMQFRNSLSAARKSKSNVKMHLAYKAPAKEGNAFYVFNNEGGNGYTIVSGNDLMPEILGYSDYGYFDLDEIPENMKVWMQGYVDQANYAISCGVFTPAKATDIRKEVNPIIKAEWDQGTPFNNFCPTVGGNKSYTGCVATAMAQVMHSYQYPERAKGTCVFNGSTVTLSTEYEWDRMLDKYLQNQYNTANADAVAQLMYDCGRAVNMKYSPTGSGAQSQNVQLALINNFSYDLGESYVERKYFQTEEWDDMMYAEIAAGRPVIYSGIDENGGGHAFILDGYRSGGFYHLNWGWSGKSNGYFRLDALNPANQGAGSGTGQEGYNYEQDANFKIQKPCGGRQQVNVFGTGDLTVLVGEGTTQDIFAIANSKLYGTDSDGNPVQINRFMNFTGREFTAQLGVKLTNVETGESILLFNPSKITFRPWQTGVSKMPIDFDGIPYGRYTLYPFSRHTDDTNNIERMRCPANQINYYVVDITAEGRTYYEPDKAPDRRTTAISLNPASATITVKEGIELKANIRPSYASDKLEWSSSDNSIATVEDGIVMAHKAGKVVITATATDGTNLSATCDVTVTEAPEVLATSISFNSATITLPIGETYEPTISILPVEASSQAVNLTSSDYNIVTIIDGKLLAVNEGSATITATTSDGSNLSASMLVKVQEGSGIDYIGGDNGLVTVYDILGNRLLRDAEPSALESLDNGVYIVNGKKVVIKK